MAGTSLADRARAKATAKKAEREAAQRGSRAIPANLGDSTRDLTVEVDPTKGVTTRAGEVVVPPCPESHEGEPPVLPSHNIINVEDEPEELEGGAQLARKRKGSAGAGGSGSAGAGGSGSTGAGGQGPATKKQKGKAAVVPTVSAVAPGAGYGIFGSTGSDSHCVNMWAGIGKAGLQGEDLKYLDGLSWFAAQKAELEHFTKFMLLRAHREQRARQDHSELVNLRKDVPIMAKLRAELEKLKEAWQEQVNSWQLKCSTTESELTAVKEENAALVKEQEQAMAALSRVETEKARAELEVARLRGVSKDVLEGARGAKASLRARAVAEALRSSDYRFMVATKEFEVLDKGFDLAVEQITHLGGFTDKFDPALLSSQKTGKLEEPETGEGEELGEAGEFAPVFEDFEAEVDSRAVGKPYQSTIFEGEDPFEALEKRLSEALEPSPAGSELPPPS